MKKIFLLVVLTVVLFSGCNKLKDETLTDNPYDVDYVGPKVVQIDNVSTYIENVNGTDFHRNKIMISSSTQYYQMIDLYRNGVLIGTFNRTDFASGKVTFNEALSDYYPAIGVAYSYQVKLSYDSGSTSLSDPVTHTTL